MRLSRLLLNTNLDLFGDFDELENPTLDWRNTFSWRLTGGLSLDYRVDVLQQPQVTEDTQLRQTLQFRYSWGYYSLDAGSWRGNQTGPKPPCSPLEERALERHGAAAADVTLFAQPTTA